MGLMDGTTLSGAESIYKYLQTHIEVLKWCTVLVRVLVRLNNYNYEQLIAETLFCYSSSINNLPLCNSM